MEVTDVNQLMSLIESGTVSIICDPTQLGASSGDIDDTELVSEETSNPPNILNQSLGGTLVIREDDGKTRTDAVGASCSVDDIGPNEFRGLHQAIKEKRLHEYQTECSQEKSSPQLQLSTEQYFIQTTDGQIIQVLGTLEQDAEGDALPEASLVEGVVETAPGHVEGSRDGVQILVMGSNSGEDVYLISTPDKDTCGGELQNSLPAEVKNNSLLEDADESCMLQPSSTIIPLPPGARQDNSLPLCKVEGNDYQEDLLQNSPHNESSKFESRQQPSKDTDKLTNIPEESQLCNKDLLLSNLPSQKNYHLGTPRDKRTFSLKIPSKSLMEGAVVRTDRGDMVAYNLSSLTQLKESSGQMSRLQNVASMFGPAMKVLRPVEPKNELSPKPICKTFSVFNCDNCSAVLHSERSLQNHQRKYHKDWEEECVICGRKFLNVQYVRSHIQEVHSNEKSFQCRLCSYKCETVKDLLRHHKSHKESRVCGYCGRKYITLKLYKKHVMSCRERRKSKPTRSDSVLSHATDDNLRREQDEQNGLDQDMGYLKIEVKCENIDRSVSDEVADMNNSSDLSHLGRKFSKISTDQKFAKNDADFKFESKHYHKQAKKMAMKHIDQPFQRPSRGTRERTHRCYLCFKLFSTAVALEAHKENYHLVKSERPVRVRTDTALDEGDEELAGRNPNEEKMSVDWEMLEQVVVKEEPVELSEDFENITIIVDESVDSPHVIKPLCIACKAYTSTDFRKHSKWFSQIPDDYQSDTLKKFQQFFPCSFDPTSLLEPWVLCKKCVVLIDKIADMEEKLSSMKHDLLSRVKGKSETENNGNQIAVSSKIFTKEDSQMEPFSDLINDNIKGLGKNLCHIEAYMKDTCEIMEITKPQKGPGRPKKHMKEKLTPILVEEKDGGESVPDIVKFITHSLGKNGQENTQSDFGVTNRSDTKNEAEGCLSKITAHSDVTLSNIKIKQEPVQCELISDQSNSDPVPWEVIPFTDQNNQFDAGNESEKKDPVDSQSFSAEIILGNLEASSDMKSQDENFESKRTESFGLDKSKSQIYYEMFPQDNLPLSSSRKKDGVDDRCDTPETLDSGDPYERDDILQDSMENNDCGTQERAAGNEEQAKMLPAFLSTEDKHDSQKSSLPLTAFQVSKRAKLQEERSKMCYKMDEPSPKPWRCRECQKSFSSERGACDHYAASHKGENYACEHCCVSYVRKRDLIGHYNKMHLNIKPYKCKLSECPETFSSHGQLYRHMQSVHSMKKDNARYECHICSASFAEKRYRDAHLLVCLSKSSDSAPHRCPFCQKAFKLARYLQLHMRTVHWKDEQFFCEICNKVLTDKKNLIIHMKSHMGETKVKCELCGKEFNRKSYLWTHMRTHTDQRPYKCNFCVKAFNQYSTWKNHERTHTGEKPYKCQVCAANFATSSSLSKHVQYSHFNIRDFQCDLCTKKFISKAKLEEHLKVHTGEKPFKCHICNRAFNKKNNLRTHLYVHSSNKKYKCELCGEGFMRKSTIENHILEHHKLEFVMSSKSTTDKDGNVTISTSQFISVKGIDDVPPEDSYIVVYADEEEELNDSKEMQVTVLAEDGISNQIGITSTNVTASSDYREGIAAMDSSADVLSEVILEDPSGRGSDALTTLISNGISSAISVPEGSEAAVSHVMEIDEASFRLVTSEDATVPIYSE